jgi:predicted nucleic acid-binding protein
MNGTALKFRRAVEKHSRVGFDTAPLIYFIEDVSPYADLLAPVFDRLEGHRLNAATSTITLAEIFTKPLAERNLALVDDIKVTLRTFTTLSIVAIDEQVAEAAALIRARYAIRLPDAIQIAAAIQEGATAFLCNDKRLRKVDAVGVMILDDFL